MRRPLPTPAAMIVLVAIALFVRGGVLLGTRGALAEDPDAYRQLAENLVEYGTFGHGLVPSAYRPPLYPVLLVPAVARGDPWTRPLIGLVHLAIGVATVVLAYRLGRCWGLGKWSAIAAVLLACDPILLTQSTLVMTETLATLLAVVALFALTAASERPGAQRAAAAGASLALASLCRPTFLVFLAVAAVGLAAFARGWSSRAKTLAAFVAAAAVVLAPWMVRNRVQLGRPVVGTTHGGFTLLLGNNPSFYDYLRHGAWGTIWNADAMNAAWSDRLAHGSARDELANDRAAYDEAWASIRREPGMFLYASLVRVGRLWAPLPHETGTGESARGRGLRYAVGAWYVAEFCLAALGLIVGFRVQRLGARGQGLGARIQPSSPPAAPGGTSGQGSGFRVQDSESAVPPSPLTSQPSPLTPRPWLWGLVLVGCFSGVHALYWTNMRMRAPLMPVVALAAAGGVAWIVGAMSRRKTRQKNELGT